MRIELVTHARSEVRRIKIKTKCLPSSVEGVVGDDEIAQVFSDKHIHPLKSVSCDVDETNSIGAECIKQIKEHVVYKGKGPNFRAYHT